MEQITSIDEKEIGQKMYKLIERLYPICRSIAGEGTRKTLNIIKEHIPIEINEIPTGTKVFDWTVPKEWNIKDAYIKNSKGEKIVDFKKSNLHVLNYSIPVNKKLSLKELKKHIFTSPDYPNWIPYLTSYYNENWGFCLTQKQFERLKEDTYEVFIDSELKEGSLSFGELFIKGEKEDEVLISTYVCHPSLCNDNLSGVALSTFLAKHLKKYKLKNSLRFLFIPETIGSITWLSLNEDKVSKIEYGLVATCVGDKGKSTYKKTRKGNAIIDIVVEKVLEESKDDYEIVDFFPTGSDERQFCSPGFDLPVGSLMRTIYGKFPEYHTSADDLNFVHPEYLSDSFMKYLKVIETLEKNAKFPEKNDKFLEKAEKFLGKTEKYLNLNPKCEPQLGKRGLYKMTGGRKSIDINHQAIYWVLNLSDGKNSLRDISLRSGINFNQIKSSVDALLEKNLLKLIE